MALIKCPECGYEISDTTKSCPNCGYRLQNQEQEQEKAQPQQPPVKKNKVCLTASIVICVIFAIAIVVDIMIAKTPTGTINGNRIETIKNFFRYNILVPMDVVIGLVLLVIIIGIIKAINKNDKTDLANLIVSFVLLLVTANLYNYQNATLKGENTPYPYLIAVQARMGTEEELQNMDIRNPISFQGEPIITWYYYGKQEAKYLGQNIEDIGIELMETNPEDRKIINEIKNNQGSVCFSKINDHNCILFINEDIESSFVLEYCSADIKIKNYGAFFHNFELESIKCFYDEEHGRREIILDAENTEQKTIPLVVEPNETIQLVYCQVTHNLINSQCITDETIISELGNSYDLLTKRMPDNALNYNKVEIIISCENFVGERFRYKLIFEKEGYYYVSKTELLNE